MSVGTPTVQKLYWTGARRNSFGAGQYSFRTGLNSPIGTFFGGQTLLQREPAMTTVTKLKTGTQRDLVAVANELGRDFAARAEAAA
jgi:hypothetical protein